MQFDASAGLAAATGCGDDTDTARRTGVTTLSQPAREDDQLERERIEADVLERERVFRATFDRAAIGIAHVSPEGRWLRFNQRLCDILGYRRAELAAHTIQEITHPDDLAAELAYVQRALAGELEAYELDKRYVRTDGTPVWTHLTVSLMRTPQGEPDYFIAMVQDITERTRLEQERAQLLEQEQATNAQLRALQALTDTALSHLALDDLLGELLDRVTAVMGVDLVSILLLDEDGQTLTAWAARGLREEYVGRVQVPVGQGFSGRVAASRAPLIVDDLLATDFEGVHPILQEHLRSLAGVPLLVEDHGVDPEEGHPVSRLVGVISMGSAALRHFTTAEVQLLQRAADRIALAIDRARLYANEQEARRQAQASETRAAERAAQLRTILETVADGVVVYDATGHRVQTNRAYHELYAADRLPGFDAMSPAERRFLLDVRNPATGAPLPAEYMPIARALRGEVVTGPDADYRMRALDGRELEVNASAAPLREPDGRVVGAVSVLRDMTERNRLAREREAARADELAAREASRRLEQFLATAAHDLRTPLTATIGYLDLAQRQTERLASAAGGERPDLARQVAAVHARLDDADQSAERLAQLLTLLFDTAAMRAGRLELHRAPHDLTALVREQVAALRVAAPDRTIRLHTPAAGGAPIPVEADVARIGQVVTNYVTNALKYAPPDRPVDVSVLARGSRARVAVRDQGPGIPEGERARVWELFHRVPGGTTQSGTLGGATGGASGSLGLGLHICKAIIAAHGGRIGVKSAVGQGSTFWFTLPLSAPMPDLAGAMP